MGTQGLSCSSFFSHKGKATQENHSACIDSFDANSFGKNPTALAVWSVKGNEEEVKEYISMGFHIGVTGWICDEKRGKDLQKAVKYIPLDRLMLETDAPYLIPKNMNNKPRTGRNEPMFLPHIVHSIAKHMNVSAEEVARYSTQNAKRFFNLN